jgi:hypothetical protein
VLRALACSAFFRHEISELEISELETASTKFFRRERLRERRGAEDISFSVGGRTLDFGPPSQFTLPEVPLCH